MKVLVLGYSVTAEGPGYVEIAADSLPPGSGIELVKIGLAGVQPHHARHLFPSILRDTQPDAVVLDQSTPAYRMLLQDREEYFRTLDFLLRLCLDRGLKFGFLDLPRTDFEFRGDWVSDYHQAIAVRAQVPRVFVERRPEMLRDEVHPTDAGRRIFADALLSLLPDLAPLRLDPASLRPTPGYDALFATDFTPPHLPRLSLVRGGYRQDMVYIAQGRALTLDLQTPRVIRGFAALMGPRVGLFEIGINGTTFTHQMYNQFCYYQRLGAVLFGNINANQRYTTRWITFKQLPDLPDIALRKGEPDLGTRLGALGCLFVES